MIEQPRTDDTTYVYLTIPPNGGEVKGYPLSSRHTTSPKR